MKWTYKLFFLFTWLFVLTCFPEDGKNFPPSNSAKGSESISNEQPIFVDIDAGKIWNIFGLKIVGKIMSSQTNGKYSVVVSTIPPGRGPPLHVHDNEEELFYVLEGEYEFRCGEQKFRVSKGGLVHLPRKLPHSFRNIGENSGVLMNTMTPGGFERFFEEIDRLPKDKPLDRKQVQSIASKYSLTFLPETH